VKIESRSRNSVNVLRSEPRASFYCAAFFAVEIYETNYRKFDDHKERKFIEIVRTSWLESKRKIKTSHHGDIKPITFMEVTLESLFHVVKIENSSKRSPGAVEPVALAQPDEKRWKFRKFIFEEEKSLRFTKTARSIGGGEEREKIKNKVENKHFCAIYY
jgi:hypothetical protein